jgi:hypothetical protein
MNRHNHYEAAFAAFLREKRVCHLAINETRRSFLGGSPAKSLDFIVHGHCGERFAVDIKGRRYPGGAASRPRRTWQSWVTELDVEDARFWAAKLGAGYQALLVFVYHLTSLDLPPQLRGAMWTWQDRHYLMRAVPVNDYIRHMHIRSRQWRTVHLRASDFQRLARPLEDFLPELRWSHHPELLTTAS